MSNKTPEILFTSDIVAKVAAELGMSPKSVNEHVVFLAHWLKTLAERDGVNQIQIPHVGHIYPNVPKSQAIINRLKKGRDEKGFTLSKNQEHVMERLNSKAKAIRAQYPSATRDMHHGGKIRFGNPWFRKGKGTAELETFQNGY